jgi:hypothetical protein
MIFLPTDHQYLSQTGWALEVIVVNLVTRSLYRIERDVQIFDPYHVAHANAERDCERWKRFWNSTRMLSLQTCGAYCSQADGLLYRDDLLVAAALLARTTPGSSPVTHIANVK